ncbi:MAG: diaminopimelate epimerase [Candidatus Omnitrophica bacterium]|nr:diaminopimelate epimerase [Candidatus Omnitrophota bacterium]
MSNMHFTKMVASGNDFVVIESSQEPGVRSLGSLAKTICDRKYGIGADGLLVLEKSKIADIKMRIFNSDGSEPKMCGNGARCVALFKSAGRKAQGAKLKIETKAGIIKAEVNKDNVKIKLTDPKGLKLDMPIRLNRTLKVNFINTGVPHAVIFVEGLDKIDAVSLGRQIRYHKKFRPAGANADFVEVVNNNTIKIRTYERGVEDETLACGTGAVASALLYAIRYTLSAIHKIKVVTKSKEILKVYFNKINNKFTDVWLEGKARIVHKGCWCDE